MALPENHQKPILSMLSVADDMAYLIADRECNIQFASPGVSSYGLPMQGNLTLGSMWLANLRQRLSALFDQPSLLIHTAHDYDERPVTVVAQVQDVGAGPQLLILLRRTNEITYPSSAPYHAATGLYSASFIDLKIDEELTRIKRIPSPFCLMAIDITPLPQPITPLGDLLRIHFRAMDTVGHAPRHGFLALLPGITLDQARLAGVRLAGLAADLQFTLSTPIQLNYNVIEAIATDTRASLLARLYERDAAPA